MSFISRRRFLARATTSMGGLLLAGCATGTQHQPTIAGAPPRPPIDPAYLAMYRAMPEERFPVPAVDLAQLDPRYYRQEVADPTGEKPGTVVVDTAARFLYHVKPGGRAVRYGVGIGRAGFAWSGRAIIAYKREWPIWTPPAEMIERQPELEPYRHGMDPGLENPLGARALYIHQNGKDTLYRLHGSTEVAYIGKAVSSGCVRLLHQDVIHLHGQVRDGSPIVVI